MTDLRPALFLDRDGTINVDTIHVSRPDNVRLIPGAAAAIARVNATGLPVIVMTNQSGIGRGLFSVDEYESVRARIDELLAAAGEVPVWVKPNAGVPKIVGDTVVYEADPETLAAHAKRYVERGARIVGRCCGSTPEHVAAIVRAVKTKV